MQSSHLAQGDPNEAETEQRRLQRLHALQVLDTEPEPLFDSLARLAADLCGTPIALLSLVDSDRQWFKAQVGFDDGRELPRRFAFCDHTIRSDEVLEVQDAFRDERFADNPLVTGKPNVRFYAGAPLRASTGERLGTLCVVDRQPRRLTAAQSSTLVQLALAAIQALELRQRLTAQARAEAEARHLEVREGEARLRAILDAQRELVGQSDAGGRLVYVNPAYARQFGLSVRGVIGRSLFEFVHADDHPIVQERIDWVLSTGTVLTSENRMQLPDGQDCWISWTNTRQTDALGRPLLHSTGRDITARVRAESALRRSERLLARTGRVAGVGGWAYEIATQEVTWTDETRRLHEVAADYKPTLETALDFYLPDSRRVVAAAVEVALAEGRPWDLELQLRTAAGRLIWARAVGEVEFDDEGRPLRMSGAFQDVTERRQLTTRLRESEEFLSQLADSLPLRIAYLDRERRYRFVNAKWCRDLGVTSADALGRTRREIFPDGDESHFAGPAEAALSGHPQQFEFEESIRGRLHRFEHRLIPDFAATVHADGADAGSTVKGFFVTGIDITERTEAERTARELADVFVHTSDFFIQADRDRRVRYMNSAAAHAMLGRDWRTTDTPYVRDLLPASTVALFAQEILPALAESNVWLGQSRARLADGSEVPVSHMVIAHRDGGEAIERFSILMRDISALTVAQAEKDRQVATVRSIANAIPSTVAVVDARGRYVFANRAFEAAVGLSEDQIVGRTASEVLGEVEFARRLPWVNRALAGEACRFELESHGPEGTRYTALDYIPLRPADGQPDGFVVVTEDITSSRRETHRLQHLAQTDALTGLLNRSGFELYLGSLLSPAELSPIAVLFVDLDGFKPVNDLHGHAAGDEVLQQVAERLKRLVRPADAVARLGGDEFAFVLPGVREPSHALRVAQSVVDSLEAPLRLQQGVQVKVGASVGGVVGEVALSGWPDLLRLADEQLYMAKAAGKGRARIASG
jgi:diguanylate cyclase (GGDEF)-like protein/PAS domain S-box-containing protein